MYIFKYILRLQCQQRYKGGIDWIGLHKYDHLKEKKVHLITILNIARTNI